ncbi:MAG: hypothetical protein HZA51_12070 [Planctomycetes bacterium]|nr:hypothetical protein [Planctomycetota bacterium]
MDFCVALFDGDGSIPTPGVKVWPLDPMQCQTLPSVQVENGLFALVFGEVLAGDPPLPPQVFGLVDNGPRPLWLQITAGGQPMSPRIKLQTAPYAFRVGFVDNPELTDTLKLGSTTPGNPGQLSLYHEDGFLSLLAENGGPSSNVQCKGSDGTTYAVMRGATPPYEAGHGGMLQLYGRDPYSYGVIIEADSINNGATFEMYKLETIRTIHAVADDGDGGSSLKMYNGQSQSPNGSQKTITLDGNSAGGGKMSLSNGQPINQETITLEGSDALNGGQIVLRNNNASIGVSLKADIPPINPGFGGQVACYKRDGGQGILMEASANSGLSIYNNAGVNDFLLQGDEGGYGTTSGDGGSVLRMFNGHSVPPGNPTPDTETVRLDGSADGDGGAKLSLFNGQSQSPIGNKETITLDGNGPVNGGEIQVRNNSGTALIRLIGDDPNVANNDDAHICVQGKVSARVYFTGECNMDIAESFDLSNRDAIQPGMVLVMDVKRPGQLTLSTKSYDKKVAGIVSGAGGLKPGVVLGGRGTDPTGETPVPQDLPIALSGRVYCFIDATLHPVEIGDLLTTSDTPGHAMKVTDFAGSQGAVLGKVMEPLEKGKKGLVLVLVALQ